MSRLQGIGTAYYGKNHCNPQDNSYITTEWFVLFLLPIIPLKSLRVIKIGKQEKNYLVAWSHTVGYRILQEIPLKNNIRQIIKTYLFAYGGIALFIGSWFLIEINDSFVWIPIFLMAAFFIWALVNSE
ncbi:MAG: hypothetical protein Q8N88_03370 [Nanoarchaeota archaeon]|nr:hypothetical protein [Nanoarchaeota archaeon]